MENPRPRFALLRTITEPKVFCPSCSKFYLECLRYCQLSFQRRWRHIVGMKWLCFQLKAEIPRIGIQIPIVEPHNWFLERPMEFLEFQWLESEGLLSKIKYLWWLSSWLLSQRPRLRERLRTSRLRRCLWSSRLWECITFGICLFWRGFLRWNLSIRCRLALSCRFSFTRLKMALVNSYIQNIQEHFQILESFHFDGTSNLIKL